MRIYTSYNARPTAFLMLLVLALRRATRTARASFKSQLLGRLRLRLA